MQSAVANHITAGPAAILNKYGQTPNWLKIIFKAFSNPRNKREKYSRASTWRLYLIIGIMIMMMKIDNVFKNFTATAERNQFLALFSSSALLRRKIVPRLNVPVT